MEGLRNEPVWHRSGDICAVSDGDRHLGHIVRTDAWEAYDATKLNGNGTGFKYLGQFERSVDAELAVNKSLTMSARPKTLRAGG